MENKGGKIMIYIIYLLIAGGVWVTRDTDGTFKKDMFNIAISLGWPVMLGIILSLVTETVIELDEETRRKKEISDE